MTLNVSLIVTLALRQRCCERFWQDLEQKKDRNEASCSFDSDNIIQNY